jgi:large subunit ribosomal protein L5
MMSLKEKYNKEAVPKMMEKFGYDNKMALPGIKKVVLNSGFGKLTVGKTSDEQKKIYENVTQDLTLIAGQRAVITLAKKSIAGFKTRKGMPMGAMVTLRGRKMYDFVERLIHIALPRSRDFRGISDKSFDSKGNLTVAIREDIIFPEISPETAKIIFGFEATIIINAKNKEEGIELFKLLGFPIKK